MTDFKYYAHSGRVRDKSDWQPLEVHLQAVADLAAERGRKFGLSDSASLAGRYHDFGKYDPDFDQVLSGKNIRVDHSTAGGNLLLNKVPVGQAICAEAIAYAILGHHAGLPDMTGSDASMRARLERFADPIDPDISQAVDIDFTPVIRELLGKMRPGNEFDLSVAIRQIFSCLVDADFRDTQEFYDQLDSHSRDREWPRLGSLLPDLIRAFDAHVASFDQSTGLNQLRATILNSVQERASMGQGLFTLTVPTGGGKTLASMSFALRHALHHGHGRIIYALPYTSIIDQTARIFRDLFGDVILEHHSAIDTPNPGQEGCEKLRLAMEDWAAPIIVTTNVQLFESLFAARPSRCRKLHNIAGSVIVLDEAQCLPRKLLMPTLRMIDTLAAHYGCSIVLCTATQPAFDSRQLAGGGLPLEGRELAPNPAGLAQKMQRARIVQGGPMEDADLIDALAETPQSLMIVNSRAHALELFTAAQEAGLSDVIHLTTRQYPAHRREIIAQVRDRLKSDTPCRLIATSLIEAGVDLDFPCGWRAEAGLESCIQATGRINREGKRPVEESTLTIFSTPGRNSPAEVEKLAGIMRNICARHEDLMSSEAIRDWFEDVYWQAGSKNLGQGLVDAFILSREGTDFPFRTMAEIYRMIDTVMLPVIIQREPAAIDAVRQLGIESISSGTIARKLQPFTVQIPDRVRHLLIKNGHAEYFNPNLRGDQFCVLTSGELYHKDSGLWWEHAEYLNDDLW